MGIQDRRIREKEALRQSILDAATQLFVDEGYENVSIRRIADKIEYAPSTIYLYFKDKTELLNTICAEMFDTLTANLQAIHSEAESWPDKLRRGLRLYIEFGLEHPNHYMITFCIPAVGRNGYDANQLGQTNEAGLRCFEELVRVIRDGTVAGAFKAGDIHVLSETVWLFIHGITSMLIQSKYIPNFPWADQRLVIDQGLAMIVESMVQGKNKLYVGP